MVETIIESLGNESLKDNYPYIGNLSHNIKKKLLKLRRKFYTENFNIKIKFLTDSKLKIIFQIKTQFLVI